MPMHLRYLQEIWHDVIKCIILSHRFPIEHNNMHALTLLLHKSKTDGLVRAIEPRRAPT
jgi:hypothetical protein